MAEAGVLIIFFPGLRLSGPLQVGRVVFWSYPSQIEEYLPEWARERADQFAEFFKNNQCEPLADLVCATIPGADSTEDQTPFNQEISYAADILCYAEQASSYGSGSIRFDHFKSHPFVISQGSANDVVAFDGLGHRTIVGLGARFDYFLPPFMSQEMLRVQPQEPLLVALGISVERWRQVQTGGLQEAEITEDRRLLRAINWYNQSGFRYSRHTIETSILHSATALEALLDLPSERIAASFCNAIALL